VKKAPSTALSAGALLFGVRVVRLRGRHSPPPCADTFLTASGFRGLCYFFWDLKFHFLIFTSIMVTIRRTVRFCGARKVKRFYLFLSLNLFVGMNPAILFGYSGGSCGNSYPE
jgi:hypothetical protein